MAQTWQCQKLFRIWEAATVYQSFASVFTSIERWTIGQVISGTQEVHSKLMQVAGLGCYEAEPLFLSHVQLNRTASAGDVGSFSKT